ncbi:uncharacterized protein [Procambarus clarkii]|uniref:uncharacterized protein isoform X2 n=1 Tax=Procambarus clarkii TaxID=6728 RepID=UPI001E67622E|nr:uncharacterized protein LOC123754418 isoform X2 [Procambarus clarkii]XP_045592771.1 uncharacterized protein LOC123754418 isoform X2 [Procambarus clarkii]
MQYHVILLTVMVFLAPTARATDVPKENTFYQLDCPGSGDMAYFLLHGVKDAFPVDYTDEELTVFANGSVIFKSIKIHHDGTHLCMRRQGVNSMFGHPVSVRVRPLPPDNLWSQIYRTQFITGLIAALVIFALFAAGCFVYKNQWRPKPQDNADEPIIRSDGYDNPAMNTVEDIEASNTKM